jgi:hypothetical protein
MSLESFFGLDNEGSGPGSAEASEKFQEQMRASAGAAKAIAGHQAAQKQQEDKLAKILMRYLKDAGKSDIVFLVIKLLQENVPGAFILAILVLADPETEKELLSGTPMSTDFQAAVESVSSEALITDSLRSTLNVWGEGILKAGLLMPSKTLEGVLTPDQKLKSLILDLLEFCLEEFFHRHGIQFSSERTRQFALLAIQAVLLKLKEVSQEKSDIEIIETPLESETKAVQS